MSTAHGTTTSYQNGCRCKSCTESHAAYRREYTERLKAERVESEGRMVHPRAPHGSAGGYMNYGCRCTECSAAWVKASSDRRRRRFQRRVLVDGLLVHPDAPHGTSSAYYNYGCQCTACAATAGIGKPGYRNQERTECDKGHEINDENTRFIRNENGELVRWKCRVCDRERTAQRRRAKSVS